MKVKVISLPYIFPGFVCFVLRYQVSVYRTIGPLVAMCDIVHKVETIFGLCYLPTASGKSEIISEISVASVMPGKLHHSYSRKDFQML